jgi:two-component system heavy metal sensor histidine kinase CusS
MVTRFGMHKRWSVALTMTIWYALLSSGVIASATAVLYWALVQALYQEDLRDLTDIVNNARLLLRSAPAAWTLQPGPSLLEPHQAPEIYLRVLDASARTITETAGMSAELLAPSIAQLSSLSGEGTRGDVLSRSGKPFLMLTVRAQTASATDPAPFIQVAMDREHDEAILGQYRERLWALFGGALVVCLVTGYLIARKGMRPVEHISSTAARVHSSTLDERIPTAGLPRELQVLADMFNAMLDRLQASFEHVSQFSDDVAHELRTPVNNLRGEIEVCLGKARSVESYRETLGSCLEECTRLSRLIDTLLFLARSDMTAHPIEREQIDVAHELATVEAFYGAAAADAGIALRVAATAGLSAQVNRTLFQQAIGNLVSNAIAYTPKGGAIAVEGRVEGGELAVTVRDTGCGISPEHLPRVLERFYRVDRARGSSNNHVGLGLAVVKSIATRHGGRVNIASEMGRGTEVALTLPA